MSTTNDTRQIVVHSRIPRDVFEQLRQKAKREDRTVSSEACQAIKKHVLVEWQTPDEQAS